MPPHRKNGCDVDQAKGCANDSEFDRARIGDSKIKCSADNAESQQGDPYRRRRNCLRTLMVATHDRCEYWPIPPNRARNDR
jgi:hypothetical protein